MSNFLSTTSILNAVLTGGTLNAFVSTAEAFNMVLMTGATPALGINLIGGGGSGTSGTSGSSGTSGIAGTDGTSGSSGISGTDGTSGTSGISGTDGTSGTSGISGTDGTSGTDGVADLTGIGEGAFLFNSGSTVSGNTAIHILNNETDAIGVTGTKLVVANHAGTSKSTIGNSYISYGQTINSVDPGMGCLVGSLSWINSNAQHSFTAGRSDCMMQGIYCFSHGKWNQVTGSEGCVGIGHTLSVSGSYSCCIGGQANAVFTGTHSIVAGGAGGGFNNWRQITGNHSGILAGKNNSLGGYFGTNEVIKGNNSIMLGGLDCSIGTGSYNMISTSTDVTISGTTTYCNVIGLTGGTFNEEYNNTTVVDKLSVENGTTQAITLVDAYDGSKWNLYISGGTITATAV